MVASVASAVSSSRVRAAAGTRRRRLRLVPRPRHGSRRGVVRPGRPDAPAATAGSRSTPPAATYTWTRYDAATGAVLGDGGAATHRRVHGRARRRPGLPPRRLRLRRARVRRRRASAAGAPGAVTTYDLEGSPVCDLDRRQPHAQVDHGADGHPDRPVGGRARASRWARCSSSRPDPRAPPGSRPSPRGRGRSRTARVTATVTPEVTTEYRWYFAERGVRRRARLAGDASSW